MTEKKHSKLGASIAKRWMNCPGSVKLCESAPEQAESEYAKEGTKAHGVMEYELNALRAGATIDSSNGEMAVAVRAMTDFVRSKYRKHMDLLIEEKVSLEYIHKGMFGTVDCAIAEPYGTLTVIDFKYGAGVAVDVVDNPQLIYYALAAYRTINHDFNTIEIAIVQPRAFHPDGPIRMQVMTVDELLDWERLFRNAALETQKPDAPLRAGSWCKWCPAGVTCPELQKKALQTAQVDFDPMTSKALPAPKDLSPKQIGLILDGAELLDSWVTQVRSYAFDVLNRGGTVPGFKLVEKRATRKWLDESKIAVEAKHIFGKKAFSEPELLSPAQLEKVVGKDWVNERCQAVSSGMTLARENDRREAVNQLELDFKAPVEEKGISKPTHKAASKRS